MHYGGTVFMTNIVNWLLTNIDRVLVGRYLSVHTVGLYTVSYNLATLPNSLLLNGLQTIFLASGAKAAEDISKLRQSYLQVLSTIFILITPAFVVLSAISPALMQVLYGEKWIGSGDIVAIMFLGVPALIVWGLSTPVLWNMGKKHHEALLQLPILILAAVFLYFFASKGAIIVAWIFVGIANLRGLVMLCSAMRSLNLSIISLSPTLLRSVVFSMIFFTIAHLSLLLGKQMGSTLLELSAASLITAFCAFVIIIRYPNFLGQEVLKMLARFHHRFKS